ncbi:MAG: fasciclin domain-containing protein [Dysgonomonas sp.]|nr:fasciclin domain-containing protein [Dysgonomonas sp.]
MNKIIKYILAMSFLAILAGCYDLQESYDYEPVNANPYLNVSAWEFIEARQDTFSLLKQAIEHVDASFPGFKDYYKQSDKKYTFMFLNNAAFRDKDGVFVNTGQKEISAIDPVVLKDILSYHIVDGYYHSLDREGSLNFDPINVITLWKSQDAVMTLRLNNSVTQVNYSRLIVNNNTGTSPTRTAVTSNLIATNGVIHVFSQQIIYKP